jgi:hypothetical protein
MSFFEGRISDRHIEFIQEPGKIGALDAEMAAGKLEGRQLLRVNPS